MSDLQSLAANSYQAGAANAAPPGPDIDWGSIWASPIDNVSPGQGKDAVPRGTGISQIPGNALRNLSDIGQGLAVTGSLAGARLLESAPSFNDNGFQWGQSPIRPGDLNTLGEVGKSIFNQYKQNYYDPIAEGRPGDIYNYAAQHPLDFATDAMSIAVPGLKALGAGKLVAPIAAKVGALSGQAGLAISRGATAVARAEPALAPYINAAQAGIARNTIMGQVAARIHPQFTEDSAKLGTAWKAVPQAEKERMIAIAEGHDPQLLSEGYSTLSPQARSYMAEARRITESDEHGLVGAGAVTPEQILRDRYKPLIAGMMKHHFGMDESVVQELSAKNMDSLIGDAQEYAKTRGIEPQYQGRISKAEASRVLREPLKPPGFSIVQEAKRAAGHETSPHSMDYERTRLSRDARYDADSYESTLARHTQYLQRMSIFHVLQDKLLEETKPITALSKEEIAAVAADPQMTTLNPRAYFAKLAESIPGFSLSESSNILMQLPEGEVVLPKGLAEAFNQVHTWKEGSLEKHLKGFANFSRRYILGFNLLWPEKQLGQNIAMLGMVQFAGPRDTMVSLSSYFLALDKRVQALVPPHIMQEGFANEFGKASEVRGPIGHIMKAADRVADFTFNADKSTTDILGLSQVSTTR